MQTNSGNIGTLQKMADATFAKMGSPKVFAINAYIVFFAQVAEDFGINAITERGEHQYFYDAVRPLVELLIRRAVRDEVILMSREVYNMLGAPRRLVEPLFKAAFKTVAHKHGIVWSKNAKLYNARFTEVIDLVKTHVKEREGKPFEDVHRGIPEIPQLPQEKGAKSPQKPLFKAADLPIPEVQPPILTSHQKNLF